MPKLAISYRRSDSSAIAGRIFDRLANHYGHESVFMDIDAIPLGSDFRTDIQKRLQQADVLLAVVGTRWTGSRGEGPPRIQDEDDPVRVEIATARKCKLPVIPVLVDGARMPDGTEIPPDLGNFVYLNAAEVATGRDFHSHMDRLIGAIDRVAAGDLAGGALRLSSSAMSIKGSARMLWLADMPMFWLAPLVLLLIAHHLIVNSLNLNDEYLSVFSLLLPFAFGAALFRIGGRGATLAVAFGLALGVVATAGMSVSQGLSSGDPIIPENRFEWLDNAEYAARIAFSYIAGHLLARALHVVLRRRMRMQ